MIPQTSGMPEGLPAEAEDRICQRVVQELMRRQSVAEFAVSLTSEPSTSPLLRGVPIVGRNGQDSTTASLDSVSIASLIKKLHAEESSTVPHSKLNRSVSLPFEKQSDVMAPRSMNLDRYKTELCRQFQETGFCKYGSKCQFAHGYHEIRNTSRHPKYKTDLCRTYHTSGICPYGARCHFIHDEDDLKLSAISQQKQQYVLDQIRQYRAAAMHRAPLSPTSSTSSRSFNPAVGYHSDVAMSIGSTGDTPPSSLSSSPAPSPTSFLYEERHHSAPTPPSFAQIPTPPGFAALPPRTAPPTVDNVFSFPELPSVIPEPARQFRIPSPMVHVSSCDPMTSLAAGLQSVVSKSCDDDLISDCFSDFYMSASSSSSLYTQDNSQDSDIEVFHSPMDISRNLRLPVFSQLSKE